MSTKPQQRKSVEDTDDSVFDTLEGIPQPDKPNPDTKKVKRNPALNGKSFAQFRLEWLDHTVKDNGLDDSAFRVGVFLNTFLNQSKLTAFPSIPTLSVGMGISEQTISDAINRLIERGHLIKQKSGIKNNNEYVFKLGDQKKGKRYAVRKPKKGQEKTTGRLTPRADQQPVGNPNRDEITGQRADLVNNVHEVAPARPQGNTAQAGARRILRETEVERTAADPIVFADPGEASDRQSAEDLATAFGFSPMPVPGSAENLTREPPALTPSAIAAPRKDVIVKRFRACYPRGSNFVPDFLIWNGIAKALDAGASEEAIMEGAKAYSRECGVGDIVGTSQVADPTRWLDRKGWEDV